MTTSGMRLEIDAEDVLRVLDRMEEAARDMTPAMESIGEAIRTQIFTAFERGTTPGGTPWRQSQRAMRDRGRTLVDTGILWNSFGYEARKDSVAIGTNIQYAAIHNDGGQAGRGLRVTLPARRFMPENDEIDWDEVSNMLLHHIMGD